jgi:EAL domain-containing protein (putative c-di-GMP-specific phosphodiesterase class I)
MVKTKLELQSLRKSEPLRDLERVCMRNLLSTTEERVYFKDLHSRFLLVSEGWIAAVVPGDTVEEVVGKTDFDFFSKEHATAAFEPEQLIRDADEAMYEAKETGRDCHRVFDSAQRILTGASLLLAELGRAIEDEELFLLYQPLFSLEDQSLIGVEALVRWRHPERGIVLPDDFIPFAEQHGLIGKIDSFVLDEACRQLSEWVARDGWPSGFTMAVNVSGAELSDPGFAAHVAEVIRRHGVPAERLCLEMTETAFVGEWGDLQETLSALSNLGVRLALDDFGTGYSSLAHLQRLKVDILKIDRSFVAQIGRSPRDREIVAAVMAMSHTLGTTVIGEGIETSQQLDTLAGLACDQGQGFLFARPLSPEAVVALVG